MLNVLIYVAVFVLIAFGTTYLSNRNEIKNVSDFYTVFKREYRDSIFVGAIGASIIFCLFWL